MSSTARLKDIADYFGVSVVTVSNALAKKDGVSEGLRSDIIKKAREIGYDISRYERDEPTSVTVGVVVSYRHIEVGKSFYWEMYQNVVYEAAGKGMFSTLEIVEQEQEEALELPRLAGSLEMDGLILLGMFDEEYVRKITDEARMPVLLLDYYPRGMDCDAVLSNGYIGSYEVTKELIKAGHRRIGFIGNINAIDNIKDRYYGYLRALYEAGIKDEPELLIPDRDEEMKRFSIKLPAELPTAFVLNGDFIVDLLAEELGKRGLNIPDDISVAGYDDYLKNSPLCGHLTTYHVDMKAMADMSLDILEQKINFRVKPNGVHYVDGRLVIRDSIRNIGQSI